MKLPFKLFIVFFFIATAIYSQDTTPSPSNPDDDFNVFLLVFASIVISLMLGAALAGVVLVTGFLFVMAAFVAAGIASFSLLAGIYNRSVTAGFKTFLYIFCPVAGIAICSIGSYIIVRLFDLDISGRWAFVAGIIGGLLGGLLTAFAVSKITKALSKYLLNHVRNAKRKNAGH